MSEYWVSRKKYFCKYCEIYIADDVPSRQQHENGLRHKGNLDKFVRGIYKASEKRVKDAEEEKREMVRVERVGRRNSCYFSQLIVHGNGRPLMQLSPLTSALDVPKPALAHQSHPLQPRKSITSQVTLTPTTLQLNL